MKGIGNTKGNRCEYEMEQFTAPIVGILFTAIITKFLVGYYRRYRCFDNDKIMEKILLGAKQRKCCK